MVSEFMGSRYVYVPPCEMQLFVEESSPTKPIIFILSSGSDPRNDIESLGKKFNMADKILYQSMGQGQEEFVKQAF